jgi:hypothetical protein
MDASCCSDSDRVAIVNNNNSNINVTPCHNLGCGNVIPDVGIPLFISVCGRDELGDRRLHELGGRHELAAATNLAPPTTTSTSTSTKKAVQVPADDSSNSWNNIKSKEPKSKDPKSNEEGLSS